METHARATVPAGGLIGLPSQRLVQLAPARLARLRHGGLITAVQPKAW